MNYENNIGKRVCKCSISKKEPNNKPFKSGSQINTIKGVIIHPTLNIPAYTFEEDDSYVECRRCMVVNDLTEYQRNIIEIIKNNPNKIIITAEQGIGKTKSTPTHEVVDLVYHDDEHNVVFQGTQQECNNWKSEQGFGYQVRPIIIKK